MASVTTSTTKSQAKERESIFTEIIIPAVKRHSALRFGMLKRRDYDSFQDAEADAIAHAWVSFCRCLDAGKNPRLWPNSIAAIACRMVRMGRKVGTKDHVRCHLRGAEIGRIKREPWQDAIADSQSPIPDQVAFRIDFPDWLDALPEGGRGIALLMATGTRTQECARLLSVSNSRVSQLRRELMDSWEDFTE